MEKVIVTYIIKSGKYYKIGRTSNLNKRLSAFNTLNPDFKLVKVIQGDYEKFLHKFFIDRHYRLEWYSLSNEDINILDDIIKLYTGDDINLRQITLRLAALFPEEANHFNEAAVKFTNFAYYVDDKLIASFNPAGVTKTTYWITTNNTFKLT